jgi:hypothetical protein
VDGVTRYPLSWPAGWKRSSIRVGSPFSTRRAGAGSTYPSKSLLTMSDGLERLTGELGRLGATSVVISTNVPVRNDGLPYASASLPKDPGVAVYFKLSKKDRCLACDRYHRLPDNMAAIAGHIEALRAIERYGVGTLDQAFAGYTALPPAADAWWLVFNLPQSATLDQVDARFRELARAAHPDAGGNHNDMARLTAAREAARKALRG